MKKNLAILTAIFAAFISFVSVARAYDVAVSTAVWNKYLSNNGQVFLDKPVWQTTYSTDIGQGFVGSITHSLGLDDTKLSSNFGDEIDWTVSRSSQFGTNKQYTLNAQVSYWDCYRLFTSKGGDVFDSTISLSRSISDSTSVSLTFDDYASTNKSFYDDGYRVTLGTSTSIPLSKNVSLSIAPALIRDDGAFGLDPAWLGQASAALAWKIGKVSFQFPQANLVVPISKVHDGRKTEVAWGGGASFSF